MAMIDAYRIGVELVLGGDLAAGIEALIPAFERLDARVTHANAETEELAAGLRDVAEAAPGIGRAADQMGRLSAAMASVNRAVDAWKSHGGGPEAAAPGRDGDAVGTSPREAVTMIGLPKEAPAVVADLGVADEREGRWRRGGTPAGGPILPDGTPDHPSRAPAGDRAGAPSKPKERPIGGIDAAMPALMTGELIKRDVAGRFDGQAKDAGFLAGGGASKLVSPVGALAPVVQVNAGQIAADIYSPTPHALPAYARDALAGPRAERDAVRELVGPKRGGDLKRTIELSDRDSRTSRVEEVENVIPILTRPVRDRATGEARLEPNQLMPQPWPMIDAPPPVVGAAGLEMPGPERVVAGKATSARERAMQERPRAEALYKTLEVPTSDAAATLTRLPTWVNAVTQRSTGAHKGLSIREKALAAARRKDGLNDLAGSEGFGSLFPLAGALKEAMDKMPGGWPSAGKGTAMVPTALVPSLTAPGREQGGGRSVTPQFHGYHPAGDQPGPVIQHVTYLHLDDREIARSVTRQQLRMMGGNVSGTLRPDPSIAPQYGAHLLET